MMLTLCIVAGVVLGYVVVVRWQMAQPVSTRFSGWFRRVMNVIVPTMEAISLWRTVWILRIDNGVIRVLTEQGERHEVAGHILNKKQWAGHPYAFPFMYAWEACRHSYAENCYEKQARVIAGEP